MGRTVKVDQIIQEWGRSLAVRITAPDAGAKAESL